MRNLPVKSHGKHLSSVALDQIIDEIRKRGNTKAVAGMARFGIQTSKAFGVSIPQLRELARKIGRTIPRLSSSGGLGYTKLAF
jgi:3-methyladenine DNA glycosylase AlkD